MSPRARLAWILGWISLLAGVAGGALLLAGSTRLLLWSGAPTLQPVPQDSFGWLGVGVVGACLALGTGCLGVVLTRERPRQ